MGGDFAPQNVVAGALDALRETNNRFELLLIGPEELMRKHIASTSGNNLAYHLVNATQVIDMHDGPTAALKQKKDSTIAVGMALHKDQKVHAFVSAGNTGAVMSASTLVLGRIEGVGRPTIGAFFPTEKGVCLIVDAGANVDCKARHLFEFGVMGSIYAREMLHFEKPSVGLLNIGEEETKGTDVIREAHGLLKSSKLNFIGNVEGRDLLQGKADVVVCDGFVGNVLLKFAESVPAFFKSQIRKAIGSSFYGRLAGLFVRSTLRSAMKGMDYEEHGGVPVLGVNGVSIIGHGKSTPKAIKNMILKAEEMARRNINGQIQEAIAAIQ